MSNYFSKTAMKRLHFLTCDYSNAKEQVDYAQAKCFSHLKTIPIAIMASRQNIVSFNLEKNPLNGAHNRKKSHDWKEWIRVVLHTGLYFYGKMEKMMAK